MSPKNIDDTVQAVLTSRVYDLIDVSPLEKAQGLTSKVGHPVYLKREDLLPIHSFKIRGAYNKIAQLSSKKLSKGVIAASAGNHAQGVAYSAKKLGISSLIVMPRSTPMIKLNAVQQLGSEIELYGDSYSDAAEYCLKRVVETGRVYIAPFDDQLVIAGQGTVGREILDQLNSVTHIFVPVGGGGLLAGVASYVKAIRPDIKIVSVEPEDSNAMQLSVFAKKRIKLSHVGIFADGVAVKQVGKLPFSIAKEKVDDFITVSTDHICAAMKDVFEDTRSILEPAGALSIAGIKQYPLPKHSIAVAICSGANITFERLQQIAERTLIGSGNEAMFSVTIPERPGSLLKFCIDIIDGHNISEFNYRLNHRSYAQILVGVMIAGEKDKQNFMKKMSSHGYKFVDLTNDDLTKEHVRHVIGGPSPEALHEHLYEITFPERSGALTDFLGNMGIQWNISLFHYRSKASDTGSVLIGFEVTDKKNLEKRIQISGFDYHEVDSNVGVKTFL